MKPIGNFFLYSLTFFLLPQFSLFAQSDGPRTHLPAPTDAWIFNVKYLNLEQNIIPSGNLLIKNAKVTIDVMPITIARTFAIGNNWARVLVMAAPTLSFKGTINAPALPLPINQVKTSGISDGWVTFEMGLINRPAQNIIEFSKQAPAKFSMNGLFRFWYSGSYDKNKYINLGSNRLAFDVGLPMSIRINNNPKKILWLETWPGIQVFTPNNEPSKPSNSSKTTQYPLFYLENHLSYNFNSKLYCGLDLRFQQGGQTLDDGVKNNNTLTTGAGGVFIGYKFLPYLDFYASYDEIFWGVNDAQSRMIRLSLAFAYIDMKKYKKKVI